MTVRDPQTGPETLVRIPTVLTARLALRAPKPADFDAFADFRAGTRAYFVGGPYTRAQAFGQFCGLVGHWHLRGFGRWIIADRQSDAALGTVGPFFPEGWLEPEIAWTVFDGHEGKGIAFEAAEAARVFAYDTLGWTTAVSLVARENTRSNALAQRLGATREGVFQHAEIGTLDVWRHPSPAQLRATGVA
ncbi:MAG: GNAT family N-acetyltransferase [Pseudomonadota bacterium]